ncbi:MAG: hypothetical protein ABI614_14010, partial [Planctomycetota bacterium]
MPAPTLNFHLLKLRSRTIVFASLITVPLAGADITYEKDVRPILKTHCFQCHGEGGELKGGL